MRNIVRAFPVIVLFAFLSACSGGNKIVGEWKSIEYILAGKKQDRAVKVTFKDDGTAVTGMGGGTYFVEGNTVTFKSKSGVPIIFEMQPDGRLKTENPATTIIYEKQ